MCYDVLRRAAVLLGLPLLVLAGAGTASAAPPGPVPLDVAVSGPATGEAGGTGEFAVAVTNVGSAKADEIRLRMQLPEGITVRGVRATDTWTCVLGPLRCTLKAGLKAGHTAEPLSVVLHYDGLVEGRQEIAAVASQEPARGGARFDRGATTVDVAPAPDRADEQPPAEPAPADPAPAEPSAAAPPPAPPAAPAPVASPAAPAPAPAAPRPTAAAQAPAPGSPGPEEDEPAPAEPEAAGSEPVAPGPPETLPFTDDAQAEAEEGDDRDDAVALTPTAADDGGLPLALLLWGLLVGAVTLAIGAALALHRRGAVAAG